MKHAVSLYEFMPYGAPELIESRPRHLSRALILTSVSSIVLYAISGQLASRIHVPAEDLRVTVGNRQPIEVVPPPRDPPPLAAPHVPVAHPSASGPAVPVPVPDAVAPTDVEPPSARDFGTGRGSQVAPDQSPAVGTVPGETGLPPPAEYVEDLPSVVKEVTPDYPQIARDAEVEGLVLVRVLVGTDGRVLEARLTDKYQIPLLNEAALAAARKWIFTPGLANRRPVTCWTAIPFRFVLHR